MLPRAAARSFRAGAFLQRPSYSSTLIRSYAKNSKPKKPTSYTPPERSLNGGRPPPASANSIQDSTTGSSDKSGQTDFSTLQDEFQTSSQAGQNTAPQDSSPSAIDPALAREREEQVKEKEEEPQIPFYDLTKGIPSTIDAELKGSSKQEPKEGADQEGAATSSSGGRGERRMPASAYETSVDRRRNKLTMATLAAMGVAGLLGVIYFGRDWDSEEESEAHPDAKSFFDRMQARLGSSLDHYTEPAFPKLLPDPDPSIERPYTLVLSLEDLLMHSEWTREHGWRIAKRPGVDYFIRYLSQYYEIAIFTSLPSMTGGPVVQKLDPYRIVPWYLFREATKYKNGEYIKVGLQLPCQESHADTNRIFRI
jgi:import inner membrane translocase subunit TIM50